MNILSTNNILIVGGGISGRRFVESYMFDDNINITIAGFAYKNKSIDLSIKYMVAYVNFGDIIDFNFYDVIILSVPYEIKRKCLKKIISNKFVGKLIIEKPFAINCSDYYEMINLLGNNLFCIPFSRRYDKRFDIKIDRETHIIWPMDEYKEVSIYYDLLPHCIDWIVRGIGKEPEQIEVLIKTKNIYRFMVNGILINIEFVNNRHNNVTVNDIEFPWIDIYKINNIMLIKLIRQTSRDEQLEKDMYYVSKIMEVLDNR